LISGDKEARCSRRPTPGQPQKHSSSAGQAPTLCEARYLGAVFALADATIKAVPINAPGKSRGVAYCRG